MTSTIAVMVVTLLIIPVLDKSLIEVKCDVVTWCFFMRCWLNQNQMELVLHYTVFETIWNDLRYLHLVALTSFGYKGSW